VARQGVWKWYVVFALGQCREAGDFFFAGQQPGREMAGVAARIIGRDIDREFADWNRAQQIGGEPRDVSQLTRQRDALDGAVGGPACWCSGCQGPRVSKLAR